MRRILGLSEWQFYAIISLVAVIVATLGFAYGNGLMIGAGVLVLLFSMFGIAYSMLKERSP